MPTCSATITERRALFLDRARERGNDLLLDIDVQGAAQLRAKLPDSISIFVLPPSRRELELRLRRRSSAENVNDLGSSSVGSIPLRRKSLTTIVMTIFW